MSGRLFARCRLRGQYRSISGSVAVPVAHMIHCAVIRRLMNNELARSWKEPVRNWICFRPGPEIEVSSF
jgi:hypothetical protein